MLRALKQGNLEQVKHLYANGHSIPENAYLIAASGPSNEMLFDWIYENAPQLTPLYARNFANTPLEVAIMNNQSRAVEWLIQMYKKAKRRDLIGAENAAGVMPIEYLYSSPNVDEIRNRSNGDQARKILALVGAENLSKKLAQMAFDLFYFNDLAVMLEKRCDFASRYVLNGAEIDAPPGVVGDQMVQIEPAFHVSVPPDSPYISASRWSDIKQKILDAFNLHHLFLSLKARRSPQTIYTRMSKIPNVRSIINRPVGNTIDNTLLNWICIAGRGPDETQLISVLLLNGAKVKPVDLYDAIVFGASDDSVSLLMRHVTADEILTSASTSHDILKSIVRHSPPRILQQAVEKIGFLLLNQSLLAEALTYNRMDNYALLEQFGVTPLSAAQIENIQSPRRGSSRSVGARYSPPTMTTGPVQHLFSMPPLQLAQPLIEEEEVVHEARSMSDLARVVIRDMNRKFSLETTNQTRRRSGSLRASLTSSVDSADSSKSLTIGPGQRRPRGGRKRRVLAEETPIEQTQVIVIPHSSPPRPPPPRAPPTSPSSPPSALTISRRSARHRAKSRLALSGDNISGVATVGTSSTHSPFKPKSPLFYSPPVTPNSEPSYSSSSSSYASSSPSHISLSSPSPNSSRIILSSSPPSPPQQTPYRGTLPPPPLFLSQLLTPLGQRPLTRPIRSLAYNSSSSSSSGEEEDVYPNLFSPRSMSDYY